MAEEAAVDATTGRKGREEGIIQNSYSILATLFLFLVICKTKTVGKGRPWRHDSDIYVRSA